MSQQSIENEDYMTYYIDNYLEIFNFNIVCISISEISNDAYVTVHSNN